MRRYTRIATLAVFGAAASVALISAASPSPNDSAVSAIAKPTSVNVGAAHSTAPSDCEQSWGFCA